MNLAIELSELPDEVEQLKALILAQRQQLALRDQRIADEAKTIAAQREQIANLEHNVRVLRNMVFAAKSERHAAPPIHQGHLLFAELTEAAARVAAMRTAAATTSAVSSGTPKKPHGRRREFPADQPRFRTVFELEGEQRRCKCGAQLEEFGSETAEELERIETCVVHEIVRKKYCCRACQETVMIAPGPARVLDKGLLGVGFVAHVIEERFLHHMPYHRQERKYASEGVTVARSVMCETVKFAADLLAPIARWTLAEVLASPFIFTDDTPVVIARSGSGGRKEGRVWVYCDGDGRCAYDFSPSREAERPLSVLAKYKGYVHADAYQGYNPLFVTGGATEVACWAHARRYFVKARISEPQLAAQALDRIGRIFTVERVAKEAGLDPPERTALREEHTRKVLDDFFDWLVMTRPKVLDKCPLAKAIDYCLHLRTALYRFLDDGRLEAENNAAERALRPLAVGRKNWLFFQRETGGERAAVLYTLVRTCHEIGINPRDYLRDVLLRIGVETDVAKLTPHGWKQHFETEVRERKQRILDRLVTASR
ncbi:MAG: IS66 family transposase [Planctomycetes bacterium]|nr:IS66 family transposase [Planctomycetota bacterium]